MHRMGGGIILEFAVIDDVLQVEASEFPSGKLKRTGEHSFAGIGFPRSFEFEPSEADHSLHLTVVNAEGDEPPGGDVFDRIEPWEPSVGAPAESIDLGWLSLCVHADPLEPTTEFYARLGFRFVSPSDPRTVRQGESRFFFMEFVEKSLTQVVTNTPLNFRGGNLREIATELSRRGFEPKAASPNMQQVVDLTEMPADGCGAFILYDPDQNGTFFNTFPAELMDYARWTRDKTPTQPASEVSLPLGRLVLCFDVRDLEKSSQFYQRLGMQLADTTDDSATFTAIPPHATTAQLETSYLLRLRQARESGQGLAFICEDPAAVSAAIQKRGIPMMETRYGPAFVDPQGRQVALMRD
jgi:catechol 2,3-dioxygenase-like lactoylglutathione lyase family enzyme